MLYNTSMPYNYAHALAGLHALQNCKNIDQVGMRLHEDAFFLGTMGPDPYYGDAYPPPLGRARSDLADRLHALDMQKLLYTLLSLSAESDVCTAYSMGFLCHVLLDNAVHPYIEARFPGAQHTPSEIAMDLSLVRRAGEPRLSVSPAAFYRTGDLDEIDALHTALFRQQFGLDTRGIYARSIRKWLRLNAFLYDPDGKKRNALRRLPKLMQYCIAPLAESEVSGILNLSHSPWSPQNARTDSVLDLIENAKKEIVLCIDQIAAGEREAALAALKGRCADAAGNVYQ